jgi:hypothetical protein
MLWTPTRAQATRGLIVALQNCPSLKNNDCYASGSGGGDPYDFDHVGDNAKR